MIETLNKRMGLPQSAYLGKRIYKKLFQENAKLGATDKKALREDIDTITWEYTLKPVTIPINPFSDEKHEYLEIAVIQANLTSRKRTERLAEIIHRAIPYPIVLLFVDGSYVRLSLATKRFSQAEKGVIVVDEFFATHWMDLGALETAEEPFLDSLAAKTLPHTDFKTFYDAIVDRVVALACASRTGTYVIERDAERVKSRRRMLAECRELEALIAEERTALMREEQFNRKVDGNVRIKKMEQELARKVAAL